MSGRETKGGGGKKGKKNGVSEVHQHSITERHSHILQHHAQSKYQCTNLSIFNTPSISFPLSLSLPLCPITHQSFSIKQINWLDILISVVFDLVEYITDVYIAEAIMLLVFLKDRSALFFLKAPDMQTGWGRSLTQTAAAAESPLSSLQASSMERVKPECINKRKL